MLTILAVVCPPAAVLRAGSAAQAAVALPLTALLYVPGVLYALSVVGRYEVQRRNDALLAAVAAFDGAA